MSISRSARGLLPASYASPSVCMKLARLPRPVSKSMCVSLLFSASPRRAPEPRHTSLRTWRQWPAPWLSARAWIYSRSRRHPARGRRSGLLGSTSTPGHVSLVQHFGESLIGRPQRITEYVLDCDWLSQSGCRSARAHAWPDCNSIQSRGVGRGYAGAGKRMYQAGVVDRDDRAEHAVGKSLGMTTDMLSRLLHGTSPCDHSQNILLELVRHAASIGAPFAHA